MIVLTIRDLPFMTHTFQTPENQILGKGESEDARHHHNINPAFKQANRRAQTNFSATGATSQSR
jgi:hypothetical protein